MGAWLKRKSARALISAGLLGWLATTIDWPQLAALSRSFHWGWGLAACALYTANRWLTTAKWHLLLKAQGLHYPFNELLRVVWVSNFLGHFLPASVGGDHVRMFTMARRSQRAPEAISTVLMERFTGTASLGLLAVAGGLWSALHWHQSVALAAIVLPAAVVVVLTVLLWTDAGYRLLAALLARLQWLPGRPFLQQLHETILTYRRSPAVWWALGISFAIQFGRVLCVYWLARGLGITLFFGEALVLVPTALFIGALPISIAGWGVRESAFIVLLGLAGVSQAGAFALSVFSRLAALISNLPGSFIYFSSGFGGGAAGGPAPAAEGPVRVLRVMDKLGYEDRMYGPARMWYVCLPGFDRQRCALEAYVLRGHPALQRQFEARGIAIQELGKGKFDLTTLWALYRLIRRGRFEVVHLDGDGAAFFGRLAAWCAGASALVHYHDMSEGLPWYVGLADRLLAPLTAAAVVTSQAVAKASVQLRHMRPHRVSVIYNAIDPDWVQPLSAAEQQRWRARFGLPAGAPVIGSLTRFQPVKDVPLFLAAAAQACAQVPQAHVLLVGDGPQREALKAEARRLGLEGRVHFAGYQEDVRPGLAVMDVVAFSSRSEGFCLALLEAMAMGKPVVVTDAAAFLEVIEAGRSGMVVPRGQAGAMAQAIVTLLQDQALARRLAAAAQQRAGVFNVAQHVEGLQTLYARLARRTAAPQPIGVS